MTRTGRALLAAACLALIAGCHGQVEDLSLEQRLARGVNLQLAERAAHQGEAAGEFHAPPAADLRRIRDLGLRHVRVRLNPTQLMGVGELENAPVERLHRMIETINGYGLAVIVTMQPTSAFKARLQPNSPAAASFANFWRALARRLADIDPALLVFEPLNEPEHDSARVWQKIQELLVGAVRAGAPRHRIVVSGHRFSDIEQLLQMRPLPYSNLLYSFHFYEPHNFTHQGANWGWPPWQQFHDWPYPSSPQAVEQLVYEHAPEAREHLKHYGRQRWDRARLAATIERAVDWAARHDLELLCTEFGAYRDGIQPRYRLAWLTDVAELLAEHDIGWTLWDYSGNFGLVSGSPGERELDTDAARALGLNVPE